MNERIKREWVAALRSGKYKQTTERLHKMGDGGPDRYCCLGVLCSLAAQEGVVDAVIPDPAEGYVQYSGRWDHVSDRSTTTLPYPVTRWADLTSSNPYIGNEPAWSAGLKHPWALAEYNDNGYTFEQIADLIEEYL